MQTLTQQQQGACVGTEMSGEQHLPICRTTNLNSQRLTRRWSQRRVRRWLRHSPDLALAVFRAVAQLWNVRHLALF